ncbi:ABC transporter permease [Nocardioides marmorisolisilvae]|uniref:Iron ABC transporter permease n=1 Tax=Nocardioides marmorisolisilvae TaxID=1542737 RepID=A0A3N0E082_9ACTN|nr:iron ABC transporter permease [Nocardioides marmorisolisilvae]RNL81251.1 iron ABC transporter permease [Nocardioides marmorisolisilvae]
MPTLRSRLGTATLVAVPLVVLVAFFLYPVSGMIGRGFWTDGSFDPGGVLDVLGRDRVHRVVWFTLWSAGLSTALAVVLGVPSAYVLHRLSFGGQRILRTLIVVPFVLPTVVVGVAFRQLIAPSGLLGGLNLDGTATAIIAALVFFNVSVVVRTVGSFWEGLDRRTEEAAAALGASPLRVFGTITLPALLPSIASAASVVFLFCSTSFGIVLTLGGLRYANVETEIYQLTTQDLDLQAAAALSVLQIAVITALLVISHRTRRNAPALTRAAERGRRPAVRDLPLLLWTAAVIALLVTPLTTLLVSSLRIDGAWSLANYRALQTTGAHNALLVTASSALAHSLEIAVQAAAFALVLGTVVAFLVSRRPRSRAVRRASGVFDGVFMLPLGVSAVTLGFGFLITLNKPPLDLRSSSLLIPIAQAMVALPLVVRTVAPVLSSIDPRQREAAASLGAGPLRVLLSVDLPYAWRALVAATGFAFAVSLGEFGATSFLSRDDNPTLPVVIFRLIGRPGAENFGMALAASVVLAAATGIVMLLVERFRVGSVGAF